MDTNPVFQKALDNFKKDLTAQQCRDFGITTLQDVKNEVNKIQIQYGSAKKLRGMSRVSKFLEAMQQLEQVVSVFLNVSEFVAFIWVSAAAATSRVCRAVDRRVSLTFAFPKGPIKFFLVVSHIPFPFSPSHRAWLNQRTMLSISRWPRQGWRYWSVSWILLPISPRQFLTFRDTRLSSKTNLMFWKS